MARFLAILMAIAGWQSLYCLIATDGKLTGLFYIGTAQPRPPEPPERVFVYPGSTGYDGQIYRVIARDPLLSNGHWKLVYGPRYWYRRILIPGAAAALGGGSPAAIDFWFVAVTDVLLAFGGVCFVRLAAGLCRPGLAAALYCAVPAVIASTDRMVLDGVVFALAMAAWLFCKEQRWGALLATLVLLPLVRETGILIAPGVALTYALRGRFRRAAAAIFTVAPALAWWFYVAQRTLPTAMDGQWSVPLLPQIARLFHLRTRAVPPGVNTAMQVFDVAAMLCLLIAFAWIALRAREREDHTLLALPMAVAATFFSSPTLLTEPYDFMRHSSVLIGWVALRLLAIRPLYATVYLGASAASLLAFRVAAMVRLFTPLRP
jgi:hypothetical protein